MSESPRNNAETFVARAALWLQVFTLVLGVLHFTFATSAVQQPLLALSALALLTISTLLTRVLPWAQRPPWRVAALDVSTSLLAITMLAAASGGARSALLPLYLAPLTTLALTARWWAVAIGTLAIAALAALLTWFTPDARVDTPEFAVSLLAALAPAAVVALILAGLVREARDATQRIVDLSATDALTGLMNLRAFEEVLQQEHRKSERSGRPYALLVVDVDNLAQVNELMGHEAGSQVLGAVASAVARSIRDSDIAARLGGDEFVVLLLDSNGATAGLIAQRIRNNVWAGTVSVANRLVRANVSVGIASFPEDHLYTKELMILADQRMQQDRELRRPPARS